jgi:hypothetical protein
LGQSQPTYHDAIPELYMFRPQSVYGAVRISHVIHQYDGDLNLHFAVYMVSIGAYPGSSRLNVSYAGINYLLFATLAGRILSYSPLYRSNSVLDFFGSTYGFSPGYSGLAYLGLGVGCLLSAFVSAKFSDRIYKYVGCFP